MKNAFNNASWKLILEKGEEETISNYLMHE